MASRVKENFMNTVRQDVVSHSPDSSPTCEKISRHVAHAYFSEKWNI